VSLLSPTDLYAAKYYSMTFSNLNTIHGYDYWIFPEINRFLNRQYLSANAKKMAVQWNIATI